MSEIEKADQSTTVFDKMKKVEEVGLLHLKGYTTSDIAELTGHSPTTVKKYAKEYKSMLEHMAESDPYFLENLQYNTLKALAEFDEISKEAWESVELATREGMITARNQALKLAMEVATKKAQLHQLMGGKQSDSDYIARMQKAETVNQLISQVVRDVIADCEHCRAKAAPMLKEAFRLMEQDEDFMDGEDAVKTVDFVDAEVVPDGVSEEG